MSQDWESRYQRGDTPWDKGRAAPPLAEVDPSWWAGGPVLVPGCGLGHDVRWLKTRGIAAFGLDLSVTAVQRARQLDPASAADYQVGDFLDPCWRPDRQVAAIWEHTCFCAIDPGQRTAYADACARLLRPGGVLVGVFFLNPGLDPGEDGPPYPTSIAALDAQFAASFERLQGWVPQACYPGREEREWLGIYRRKGV